MVDHKPFVTEANTPVEAKTMAAVLPAALSQSATDGTVLELPYVGGQLALDLFLPPQGQSLSAWEKAHSESALATLLGGVQAQPMVAVTLPTLTLNPRYNLTSDLGTLGLGPLFSPSSADLSGIDGQHDLFVQWVIQQAHLVVDESGTVASAATGIGVGASVAQDYPQVNVNRPFVLILRDIPTGAWLFIGRIADPTAR